MIDQKVEAYIERWGGGISRGGNETANLQMFLTELCTLLDLPQPEPARTDRNDNAYTFERSITEQFANGGKTSRRIDLYKRSCFILANRPTAMVGMRPSPKRSSRLKTMPVLSQLKRGGRRLSSLPMLENPFRSTLSSAAQGATMWPSLTSAITRLPWSNCAIPIPVNSCARSGLNRWASTLPDTRAR